MRNGRSLGRCPGDAYSSNAPRLAVTMIWVGMTGVGRGRVVILRRGQCGWDAGVYLGGRTFPDRVSLEDWDKWVIGSRVPFTTLGKRLL